MDWLVYKLTSPSGRSYIGVTSNLEQRLVHHSWNADTAIGRALRKYGIEVFSVEVLFEGTREDCYSEEAKLVDAHGTLAPAGYNLVAGGEGGAPPSPVLRERMSRIQKDIWAGDERRREVARERMTPETKGKINAGIRGYWTPERRARHSEAMRARWASSEGRAQMLENRT